MSDSRIHQGIEALALPVSLRAALANHGLARLYPCVPDLIADAISPARFPPGTPRPDRQSVTQFLAAWSRHAGLTEEECRGWLVEYCATRLSRISKSSPAAIRLSTKSNIKYIYGSAVAFLCQGEANPFRACCRRDCPVFAAMAEARQARDEALENPPPKRPPTPRVIVPPTKVLHREAFLASVALAQAELAKGRKVAAILRLLRARGMKTRTGRSWTYGILCSEMAKMKLRPPGPA